MPLITLESKAFRTGHNFGLMVKTVGAVHPGVKIAYEDGHVWVQVVDTRPRDPSDTALLAEMLRFAAHFASTWYRLIHTEGWQAEQAFDHLMTQSEDLE